MEQAFYQPTVMTNVTAHSRVAKEEIFGTVLPVMCFESDDEAIAMANSTDARLAAYAYTLNVTRAANLSNALAFGVVGINDPRPVTWEAPFGGAGISGIGREGGREGMMDFLEPRTVGYRIA